jgi:hypothetical protein
MTNNQNFSSRALLLLGLALAPSVAMAQTQTPSTPHEGMTNSDDKMGGMMDKPATQPGTAGKGRLAGQSGVMLSDHTMRASKLIGLPVYNDQGEEIGTVDDIVVTAGAVEPTVVVSVGRYLGLSEKLTSEPLSSLKLGKADKMMMPGATKAMLTSKVSYTYRPSLEGGGG